VYTLGEGEDSKLWLASTGCTVEQLFLSHVTKVVKAIKETWPDMNIIMWDDMMRGMSQDTLKVSLLEKYCSAGMSDLWAASSFKGSTFVHTCVTSTQRHVDNHLQWLKVAASLSAAINMKGMAITGWQRVARLLRCFSPTNRYDHLSVLCELLPVALPSLASCLQTLIHGEFSTEAHRKVTEMLGVSSVEVEAMERYLDTMQKEVEAVRKEMVNLYPDSTAEEWIEEHVTPVMAPLQRITEAIQACVKEMVP
ncbi:hypothetical protein XENOCAPTIV_030485, partial [Xenoophorus captivus]